MEYGRPITHWTQRELVDELIKQQVVESISTSEIGRILRENDLQPHRNRYWLNVKPDEFRNERINNSCSVYANAATTSDELIISYDEMTGVQARLSKYDNFAYILISRLMNSRRLKNRLEIIARRC
jgi:hypothetical protein